MFEHLRPQPGDPILSLMAAYGADPRDDKIDLGVGVYRNAAGVTPVMAAVKAAEQQLWDVQQTKGYTGLAGDPVFVDAMARLVLGDDDDGGFEKGSRAALIAGAATVGGTGALRQGFELAKMAAPAARVFLPDPSWPNHLAMIEALGMTPVRYRYFDAEAGAIDSAGMLTDLAQAGPGDVVILHGCCHNPTGADPNPAQWDDIIAVLGRVGAVPLVDLAYLGFADGLVPDAAATRKICQRLPEAMVAVSCSKNFGLYRDRAGVVLVKTATPAMRGVAMDNLATLNRLAYSFPADHGARLVQMILDDPALRADWVHELDGMRDRVNGLRSALAMALRDATGSDRFGFLAAQRGMFSRLGATPGEVEELRKDHAVYMVGDGRMNVAGLAMSDVPRLAEAIAKVVR